MRSAYLVLFLAAYLLTSLPHGALVLCFGADGHVALEGSNKSCCRENTACLDESLEANEERSRGVYVAPPGFGCVPRSCNCLDLPVPPMLGHRSVGVERPTQAEPPTIGSVATFLTPGMLPCVLWASFAMGPALIATRVARHLRVTVLRC